MKLKNLLTIILLLIVQINALEIKQSFRNAIKNRIKVDEPNSINYAQELKNAVNSSDINSIDPILIKLKSIRNNLDSILMKCLFTIVTRLNVNDSIICEKLLVYASHNFDVTSLFSDTIIKITKYLKINNSDANNIHLNEFRKIIRLLYEKARVNNYENIHFTTSASNVYKSNNLIRKIIREEYKFFKIKKREALISNLTVHCIPPLANIIADYAGL